jgi:hypothetical protein
MKRGDMEVKSDAIDICWSVAISDPTVPLKNFQEFSLAISMARLYPNIYLSKGVRMSDTEMAEVTSVTAQRREDQSKGQEEQGPQPALSGTQLTALGRSVRFFISRGGQGGGGEPRHRLSLAAIRSALSGCVQQLAARTAGISAGPAA